MSTRDLIETGEDLLRAAADSPDAAPLKLLTHAKKLKEVKQFGVARRLLEKARRRPDFAALGDSDRRKIHQQCALCTYKDDFRPLGARLDAAIEILRDADPLATTTNQETLGLAGSIYKRKWQADGRREHLEVSLSYYLRGHRARGLTEPGSDQGYTGINAAFVLDLLATEEERQLRAVTELSGTTSSGESARGVGGEIRGTVERRREEAIALRREILAGLSELLKQPSGEKLKADWWFLTTLGEAAFGVRDYAAARQWLLMAVENARVDSWQRESTVQQLVALAETQPGHDMTNARSEASRVVAAFCGGELEAVRAARLGKVGVALSGGGFRAAFYHIGVLACLAEFDMLRFVEVLSCVSGGSIIGAYYYLELRKLLLEKSDAELTPRDYVDLMKRVERNFFTGVESDIRASVVIGARTLAKLLLQPGFSATERLAELYERRIFAQAGDDVPRRMLDLHVKPKGEPDFFTPKLHNGRRRAKVPTLVLNATSLNTGHNWQFTGSWLGESPERIDGRVDTNERLRRLYYDEAGDDGVKHLSVGQAVAASAAVPGIFPPLELKGLYPDRVVRLVDGGVHDNQGTGALLDQDCTLLVVSDASGQSGSVKTPSDTPWGVGLRANELLQARIRAAQFEEVTTRRQANLLRGLLVVHLRKDLKSPPVDWQGCDNPAEMSEKQDAVDSRNSVGPQSGDERNCGVKRATTPYGILPDFQQRISEIRTDLDRFTQIEAQALMASGYLMTVQEMQARFPQFAANRVADAKWDFLAVKPVLAGESDEQEERRVAQHLSAASRVLGRFVTDGGTLMRSLAILAPMLLAIGVAIWGVGRATALLAPGLVESLQSLWKQTAPTGGTMFALAVATIATWLAAAAIPMTRGPAIRIALGAAYRLAYLGLALPALASREVWARVYAARGRLK